MVRKDDVVQKNVTSKAKQKLVEKKKSPDLLIDKEDANKPEQPKVH